MEQAFSEKTNANGHLNKTLETLLGVSGSDQKDSFGLKLTQIGSQSSSDDKPTAMKKTKKSLKQDFQDSLSMFERVMQ